MADNFDKFRPDWTVGTLTLTGGSTAFTATNAELILAAIREGDAIITPSGLFLPIETLAEDGLTGTLSNPAPAAATGTFDTRIRYQSDNSRFTGALLALTRQLTGGNLQSFGNLQGLQDLLPIFLGPGSLGLINKSELGLQDPNGTLAKVADFPDAQDLGGKLLGLKDDAAGRASARRYIRATSGEFRNLIINPLFSINQRAVSGTVTLSSGQFGHDRMKAGAGGCTYTFSTNNGVTTLNITSGSIFQIIEASAFAGRAGTYVLSWAGTAQGRIMTDPWGVSGEVSRVCDGSSNVSVEFTNGTVSLVQFERDYVTDFCTRHVQQEIDFCQRYWQQVVVSFNGMATNGASYSARERLVPEMRATPSLTSTVGGVSGFPSAVPSVLAATSTTVVVGAVANATVNAGTFTYTVNCNAEI